MSIRIIKGGLLTTVQDLGRKGYQRYGVSVSGVVDEYSCVIANILVGNDDGEAVLESTLMGPEIQFTTDTVIAVTGGDLSPCLNGKKLQRYRAVQVRKGDVLSFGDVVSGCRAYIAFAGGLDVKPVMGSRSTYVKAKLGGVEGRKLKDGDVIGLRDPKKAPKNIERRFIGIPELSNDHAVFVLMGPNDDAFTEKGIKTFLSSVYTVTNESDRMGCRLSGEKIEHVIDGNIITDGISFGAIQVPTSGEPIVMLSDRQTTGGYAKIACVTSASLPILAQCKAGDTVRFIKTDIESAEEAYIARKEFYRELRRSFDEYIPAKRKYAVNVNGREFVVEVESVKEE